MIDFVTGDIFEARTAAVVNPVNCVGVAGKGLALQFKERYPENFLAYKAACARGDVQLGRVLALSWARKGAPGMTMRSVWIVNFPTKNHWREKSKLDSIRRGLAALVAVVRRCGIPSIAIPALGCGEGGLDWKAVRGEIGTAFAAVPHIYVRVYSPRAADGVRAAVGTPTADDGEAVMAGQHGS